MVGLLHGQGEETLQERRTTRQKTSLKIFKVGPKLFKFIQTHLEALNNMNNLQLKSEKQKTSKSVTAWEKLDLSRTGLKMAHKMLKFSIPTRAKVHCKEMSCKYMHEHNMSIHAEI